jgi:hypothetical protein
VRVAAERISTYYAVHATPIPDDVVAATRERYVTAYERLSGEPFDAWLERTAT